MFHGSTIGRDTTAWARTPTRQRLVTPYSVDEVKAYCLRCQSMIESAVDRLDLGAAQSGFPWYRMSKLEHQFVNLRHLQHHTGQLVDRLRQVAGHGVSWRGGSQ